MIRCKKCGILLKDEAKFCPSCGTKVKTAETPADSATDNNVISCPSCGKEIKSDAKFCPYCGANTDKPKAAAVNPENNTSSQNKCPDCGTELKPGAKFCPVCGKNLSDTSAPETVKTAAVNTQTAEVAASDGSGNKCPDCGAELKPGAKFCPVCGKNLSDTSAPETVKTADVNTQTAVTAPDSGNKCPDCGTELKPGAKFCPVCGKNLSDKSAPETVKTADVNTQTAGTVAAPGSENKCPDCGAELKPGAKFCPVCGKNLSDTSAPETVKTADVNTQTAVTAPDSGNKCPDCGTELKPGAKFCPVCGKNLSVNTAPVTAPVHGFDSNAPTAVIPSVPAEINTPVPPVAPASPYGSGTAGAATVNTVKKPFNFKPLIIVGAAAVVVVVAIIVIVNILNRPPTVNLDDYIIVDFTGTDGYGKASVSFNKGKFEDDWADKLQFTGAQGQVGYGIGDYLSSALSKCYSLDKKSNLSNGDKVKVKWDISNSDKEDIARNVRCELQYSDKEFTVEGLDEMQTVDVFEGITVAFDGQAPNGIAAIEGYGKYNLEYNIDKPDGLSNGEEVKVTASAPGNGNVDDYLAEYRQVKAEATEKTFTVEGLPEAVDTVAKIPADALASMKKETEDFIMSDTAKDDFTLKNYEYVGAIMLNPKNHSDWSYDTRETYIVYKVNITVNGTKDDKPVKTEDSYYTFYKFGEMTIVDGTASYDINGEPSSNYINFDNVWSELRGYEDYPSLFNRVVTQNLVDYTYDTDITENSDPVQDSDTEDSSEPEEVSKPEESSEPEESSKSEESSEPEESSKSEESSNSGESSKSEESSSNT